MTATGPHFHITGSAYNDGQLTVDGQPFPWPIKGVSWRLDNDSPFPDLTVVIAAERITVDHHAAPQEATA